MKNKPGVLILEGHVQGLSLTRSLGEANIPVYVIDRNNCLARYSRYCLKFFRCPDYQNEDFIEFLIELATQHQIFGWALFPSNDHIVNIISTNKSRLTKYFKVITPGQDILSTIYNKRNLLRLAERNQIPVPRTFYYDTIQQIEGFLPFPLLIKGTTGLTFYKTFHVKVIKVDNLSELNIELQKIEKKIGRENYMVQELIPYHKFNNVISFSAFCISGQLKVHWIGEKLREHPIKYGTATFSQSIQNETVLEQSISLLRALNYTGVCEIEYLKDPRDEKYKLIEINPRTWLWVGLAKASGINYGLIMYKYLNNLDIQYPSSYQIGIKWINCLTDIIFSLNSISRKQLSIANYIKSLKGKIVFAVFAKNDILPSIIFPFLSLYIYKKRR